LILEKEHKFKENIFLGESKSVNENNLKFSIGENNLEFKETESEDMIIIGIIGVISIGVAIFYLKGYKK